ncbi:DUF5999 family protein [Streptomyces goshikiensis]|uniref:DUF5999 family protein n=1 Tax=Streptomyces goshikiensis TaxID=1942 RepID=UPI00364D8278
MVPWVPPPRRPAATGRADNSRRLAGQADIEDCFVQVPKPVLCNGVLLFEDGGELLPDAQIVTPVAKVPAVAA